MSEPPSLLVAPKHYNTIVAHAFWLKYELITQLIEFQFKNFIEFLMIKKFNMFCTLGLKLTKLLV